MSETGLYMTKEFFAFAKAMEEITARKIAKQDELHKLIELGKAELAKMDDEAGKTTSAWEEWKKNFLTKKP